MSIRNRLPLSWMDAKSARFLAMAAGIVGIFTIPEATYGQAVYSLWWIGKIALIALSIVAAIGSFFMRDTGQAPRGTWISRLILASAAAVLLSLPAIYLIASISDTGFGAPASFSGALTLMAFGYVPLAIFIATWLLLDRVSRSESTRCMNAVVSAVAIQAGISFFMACLMVAVDWGWFYMAVVFIASLLPPLVGVIAFTGLIVADQDSGKRSSDRA